MSKRLWLIVFAVLLITTGSIQAQETVDQTLFLTFVPNIQFSPVYVALEKGYFAEEGINLTIEHGDEPVGVDLIAAGERQFGIISGEQVITARENGRPVTFVYEWFQQYPVAIVTPDNSGIESVTDLAGRTIGLPGRFGATYSGLLTILAANGMSESDLNLQEIGFNAPEVVCLGAVEAAAVYSNNEPLVIQNLADAGDCGDVTGVRVFPVSDYADLVSNGLVTNEDTIQNDPELVRAMVRAFDRGIRDVIDNPAEAYLISAEYVEGLTLDDDLRAALEAIVPMSESTYESFSDYSGGVRMELGVNFDAATLLQMNVLLNTIALWQGEDELGYTDPDSWQTTADTLVLMGLLEEAPDLTGAYSNDFLPVAE